MFTQGNQRKKLEDVVFCGVKSENCKHSNTYRLYRRLIDEHFDMPAGRFPIVPQETPFPCSCPLWGFKTLSKELSKWRISPVFSHFNGEHVDKLADFWGISPKFSGTKIHQKPSVADSTPRHCAIPHGRTPEAVARLSAPGAP